MNREEKINFIIDNYPEFNEDTPQEWKDKLKAELKQLDDEKLESESVVKRAAELLKANPSLKHYEAMRQARRELDEMDRGAVSGIPKKKRKNRQ